MVITRSGSEIGTPLSPSGYVKNNCLSLHILNVHLREGNEDNTFMNIHNNHAFSVQGWSWFVAGICPWSLQSITSVQVVKWTCKDYYLQYIPSDPWLPWPNYNQHISKCNQIICKLIFFCQRIAWYLTFYDVISCVV